MGFDIYGLLISSHLRYMPTFNIPYLGIYIDIVIPIFSSELPIVTISVILSLNSQFPIHLLFKSLYFIEGGFTPVKSRVFSYLPKIERQWYLAFSVKPTGTHRDWSNIIHLTAGRNKKSYGDRTPAVWFNKGRTALHICTALNRYRNYCWNSRNLPLNKFTKVEIRQTWDVLRNEYRHIISIDGVVKHTTVNNAKQEFKNVVFYASDPWYAAAKVVLKNLVFKNLPHGKFQFSLVAFYFFKKRYELRFLSYLV